MDKGQQLLDAGVALRDPARVDIRGTLDCGADVTIDVNVIFEGRVVLGDGVCVGANVIMTDCVVAAGATILPGCHLEGAEVGPNARVGPLARLRPGTVLAADTCIGNFVETKNARIGRGSKANHLAYIGDAVIGADCNIGAGVVFCNYDGANKHQTAVGDRVFIGSNSVLVAPLTLADDSFVAAGSTITGDVRAGQLAVGRARQRNLDGWQPPRRRSTGES